MEERGSVSLDGKLLFTGLTIEHSMFYAALGAIMLCAVVFLALPSLVPAMTSSGSADDFAVTLAGAGTEKTVDPAEETAITRTDPQHLLLDCTAGLESAFMSAGAYVSAQEPALHAPEAASQIGYQALQTVADERMMSYTDYSTLLQIVEAECTGGDELSKQYVACVVLNRTRDGHFPDTVYDVVWQRLYGQAQFSPTQDGRMGTLKISDSTVEAVSKALTQEDISQGALFFIARKHASKRNAEWFDTELEYLFSHGGHEFFRFREDA